MDFDADEGGVDCFVWCGGGDNMCSVAVSGREGLDAFSNLISDFWVC